MNIYTRRNRVEGYVFILPPKAWKIITKHELMKNRKTIKSESFFDLII